MSSKTAEVLSQPAVDQTSNLVAMVSSMRILYKLNLKLISALGHKKRSELNARARRILEAARVENDFIANLFNKFKLELSNTEDGDVIQSGEGG